jgi:hypothetical protein
MKPLSFNQVAKLTAGASGGLIVTNAATSVAVMPTGGPESTLGRAMRVGVPFLAAGGIMYGLPRNEYTQGAAVGAALVAVSQVMSMVTMMFGGGEAASPNNGQAGMGKATRTAAMGGGVPASRALSRANSSGGMGIDRSTELLQEKNRTSKLEMD